MYRGTVCLCVACGRYKPRDQFYKNKMSATGVTSYCKECYKLYNQRRKSNLKG